MSPQFEQHWRWARRSAAGCLVAFWVLLAVAVLAQPAFDLRRDLVSDVAADGAAASVLGQGAVLAGAGAFGALAVVLASRAVRTAAVGAAVGGASLLGVALVRIECPRGANGCSGPGSGRAVPRPLADVVHRDLVAVFEVAVLVVSVATAVRLLRRPRGRPWGVGVLLAAAASTVTLAVQQRGSDIGYWQLGWLVATMLVVVLVLLADSRGALSPAGPAPR